MGQRTKEDLSSTPSRRLRANSRPCVIDLMQPSKVTIAVDPDGTYRVRVEPIPLDDASSVRKDIPQEPHEASAAAHQS